jgi:hypothetical protein
MEVIQESMDFRWFGFLPEFVVEEVVLDKGFDVVFFHEAVVSFTSVSRNGRTAGRIMAEDLVIPLQLGYQGQGVGGIGVQMSGSPSS